MNAEATFKASSREVFARIGATPGGGNQRGAAWSEPSPNQPAPPRNHGGGGGQGVVSSGPPHPTLLSLEPESLPIKCAPDPDPDPDPNPNPNPNPNPTSTPTPIPSSNPSPNPSGGRLLRAGRSGT